MSHLDTFRAVFKLDAAADLSSISVAVEALAVANAFGFEKLAHFDSPDEASGFRIHCLLNLLERTFEHAQAMLVARATGSPSSAEALGRVVVEGSVNVMYLALQGNAGTLVRYLRSWLTEHERKLGEWKARMPLGSPGLNVPAMIEERRALVADLNAYLDLTAASCAIDDAQAQEWPKTLLQRFVAIGRETDYYESYHRLSGASHLTSEDTLQWLISLAASDDAKQRMANESWAYTTMMTRIASTFFVDAVASSCIAFQIPPEPKIAEQRRTLVESVREIAREAGVPLDAGMQAPTHGT